MSALPDDVAHLPVCPKRRLPIPYIAEITPGGVANFTILDHDKAAACLAGRLCAMCGLPMGDEVALVGDEVSTRKDSYWIEPPVHERCAELAVGGLCPYLSRQGVPRRQHGDDVALLGLTAEQLAQVGRDVPKRAVTIAIAAEYDAVRAMTPNGPMTLYRAPRLLRVRRFRYEDGRLAEVAPRETVRVQRRKSKRGRR